MASCHQTFKKKISKERRRSEVFVPQLSKEWRRSEVFVPQLSKYSFLNHWWFAIAKLHDPFGKFLGGHLYWICTQWYIWMGVCNYIFTPDAKGYGSIPVLLPFALTCHQFKNGYALQNLIIWNLCPLVPVPVDTDRYGTVCYGMVYYVLLRYGILHVVTLRYFRYYGTLRYVSH